MPPDQIKASETERPAHSHRSNHIRKAHNKGIKGRLTMFMAWWHKRARWQQLAIAGGVVVFGVSSGLITYAATRPEPNIPAPVLPTQSYVPPKPKTEASRLTGIQVKPEVNKKAVIAVMIENSPDARPQSGLRDAGIVYEAIAEAGITRFLTLFLDVDSKHVGPVRSARPYYVRWAKQYDAPYAHVGGSPNALRLIKQSGLKDLDQFSHANYYERISSRYAPHNVYTSLSRLRKAAKSHGWTKSEFTGFKRAAEAAPASKPTATKIKFDISGDLYNVEYRYNKKTNDYPRFMAGQKHTDAKSGKQLAPEVVIALIVRQGLESDGLHLTYQTSGTGKAVIFQNGKAYKVTWKRTSNNKPLKFYNENGSEFEMAPGQTWLTAIGARNQVSY